MKALDQALSHYTIACTRHKTVFHFEEAVNLLAGINYSELPQNDKDIYNVIADGLRIKGYLEQAFA